MRCWSDPVYEEITRLVNDHCGMAFGSNSAGAAEAGTRRVMERLGLSEVADYASRLHRGQASVAELAEELTVGETWFFRQPGRFEFIRRHVLPDLLRRRPSGVLRAWSAGCSTGEEPYSLAIAFEEAGVGDRWQILATDISRSALSRAEEAAYGIWSLRGMDEALVRRHFHRAGSQELLDDRIRRRVIFRHANLAAATSPPSSPGGPIDLILCCNVLMYLDRERTRRVARVLYDSLADGGWLITGATDPSLCEYEPFQAVLNRRGVMYRRVADRRRAAAHVGLDGPAAVCA